VKERLNETAKAPLKEDNETQSPAGARLAAHPILLYDGVCGLCNRLNQFVLRCDPKGLFRFAALQSSLAAGILARHGLNAADLDTVYVVLNYNEAGESLRPRSDAALYVLEQLGGIWRFFAFILKPVPRPLRDVGYRLIARSRYRIFGRYDTCPLPSAETRARFLDQ
jgi:predicted DCC family thiol-disulfide oxidoreductase YuxK